MLAVLVASLAPLVAQLGPLDRLLQAADRIAVARVEAVRPLKNSAQQVAELSVTKVLYGPEKEALVLFPATVSSTLLAPGQTVLLFLQRSRGSPLTTAQERALAPLLQGAPLYIGVSAWKVEEEHAVVPLGTLPKTDGPLGAAAGAGGDHVALEELVPWLARRIDASLPSIRVIRPNPVTGSSQEFTIAPDGRILGRGASKDHLESAELESLWNALEKERPFELPESVGASRSPEEGGADVEIRTRQGRRVVHIDGDALENVAPELLEPTERALRIWHALPIAEPALSGPKK